MISRIDITKLSLDRVKISAENCYPSEACGFLVGQLASPKVVEVIRVVEAKNILAAESNTQFEADPKTRIMLEKEIRGTPVKLVGHYHSHPDCAAIPSATDLKNCFEPELLWLIISVNRGKADTPCAYQIFSDQQNYRQIDINTVQV
ncbi:MAG: hypothetical protein CFH08_01768 [Alphaproteobacteria bacterium MarineAlpha3_Bin7]|nr:MAG: hypothetical protein CFH08_01768 [Alphaproteobacteria bacterium MarineAlpha3_Bin7]|tara:strand:+ start:817 stop:1257 length:441 start_codon:yes stop_codon:yes gene_type:complete